MKLLLGLIYGMFTFGPAYSYLNNLFEETVTIKNKFNRLMLFESNSWHGANDYSDKENLQNGDRLTFTFFVEQFTAKKSPVYRMRNYS